MSSVSSTSGSSLQSTIRGYGGLASGIDRDTMIEEMTSGTRSKIAQQKQKQTKLEWEQEVLRSITDKTYNFTNKFTSYTSSATNLLSSAMYARSVITPMGSNSDCVSVSGTASAGQNLSIAGIKQLAVNASRTTSDVSDRELLTKEIALTNRGDGKYGLEAESDVSTIAGETLYIKYGSKTVYNVSLAKSDDYDYTTMEGTAAALNAQLAKVSIGNDKTLADVMDVSVNGNKFVFTAKAASAGNKIEIADGSNNLLQNLGILNKDQTLKSATEDQLSISKNGSLTARNDAELTEKQTTAERLSGSRISFNYNGTIQWITLGEYSSSDTIDDVKTDLQGKLDEAFGKNRIQVGYGKDGSGNEDKTRLSFTTTKPVNGSIVEDGSSTLSITAGDGVLGRYGVFGMKAGESNRVNMNVSLAESGLKAFEDFTEESALANAYKTDDTSGNDLYLSINGTQIKGIKANSTVNDIIKAINNSEAGVTVSYQSLSDRFVISSKENGASGNITFDSREGGKKNLANLLFDADAGKDITSHSEFGKDAVVAVRYPGSTETVEITRSTNTLDLDGMKVSLKRAFGYEDEYDSSGDPVYEKDDKGNIIKDSNGNNVIKQVLSSSTEDITFNAEVNADKVADAVKQMIDAYNEIVEQVNTEVSTKPKRDYQPLTEEQEGEMTESQIEKWNEKAKAGILFADSDLRAMADALRSVVNGSDTNALSKIGITTSTSYGDNGKLVFDEETFKAALQADSENVRDLLSRTAVTKTDSKGNKVTTTPGGLVTNIQNVMNKYGATTGSTKGILIQRAGSVYAPTSILSNSIQKELDDLDDYIDKLQDRLETETDRYISQFTTLESLISQMNSQSSYLSSMFA